MRFYNILLLTLALSTASEVKGQGLNNKYEIDATDIKNSLKLLGIEVYKFPVYSSVDGSYLNYVIEEYEDGMLVHRDDNLRDLQKQVDEKYLPRVVASLRLSHDTDFFRIQFYDKPGEPFELQVSNKSFSAKVQSRFDRNKYGMLQTRGFNYLVPEMNRKVPVLTVYAHKKGEKVIHCPGDAAPDDIKKMYEYVCLVYLEQMKLK